MSAETIGLTQPAPAPIPLDLRREGLRLETAASTLNGLAERGDAGEIDVAIERYQGQRSGFRALLAERIGIPAGLLERWLSL